MKVGLTNSWHDKSVTSTTDSWFIDSGASSHIACSLNSFTSYTYLTDKYVLLPNQSKVKVSAIGIVQLSNFLVLKDVLYIPNFTVNLVSVSKLLEHNTYDLIFTDSHFYIQDKVKPKMIGMGNLTQGLY